MNTRSEIHAPAVSVTIVLLAAGQSSRMGGRHKLLATFAGVPLVRRSALAALGCLARSVVVVSGHRRIEIENAVADLDLRIVHNENHLSGMASSIACGVTVAEGDGSDGVMVMLADMPGIKQEDLDKLLLTFGARRASCIVRAVGQGKPGNPVIFPRQLYGQLKGFTGDNGARRLIETSGIGLVDVEIGEAARIDVDTPEQMRRAGGTFEIGTDFR
ncbi:nucleotidyltransferase family protein (plasmid) [Sinorhizobium sp. B11]